MKKLLVLLLCLINVCLLCWAQGTVVQHTVGTTAAITVPSTSAGTAMIVFCNATATGSPTGVTDNGAGGSDTYTEVTTARGKEAAGFWSTAFYSNNIKAGVTTVTCAGSGAEDTAAFEVSGQPATGVPIDVSTGTVGGLCVGTTCTSKAVTTKNQKDLLLSYLVPAAHVTAAVSPWGGFLADVNGVGSESYSPNKIVTLSTSVWTDNTSGDAFGTSDVAVLPSDVSLDAANQNNTGAGNTSIGTTITVATGHQNLAIVALIGFQDTGSATISNVSGAGATWSQFSTGVGLGSVQGAIWVGIAPTTGAQTVTATISGTGATGVTSLVVYSMYNVNQTTPLLGAVYTTTGGQAITAATGDMPLSTQFDTNTQRTVTGCTTATDSTGFTSIGWSATHCVTSPTSTFTWSGFNATGSIAVGVDVQNTSVVTASTKTCAPPFCGIIGL